MKPLITIIVPVYKVEKYIDNCIESLTNQTYTNIEIILVNDGSPDNCPSICEKWKKIDNRIVLLNKENGGLSDARNAGMKIAKGDYFIFVDSDDYVSKDYVAYLFDILESTQADIAVGKMEKFMEGSSPKVERIDREYVLKFNATEAIKEFLYEKHFTTNASCKIYKKELFEGVEFPVGKKYEDLYTLYRVVSKCDVVAYGNRPIYYYLVRSDSIIGTLNPLKNKDFLLAAKEVHSYVLNHYLTIRKAADFKLFQASIEMFVKLPENTDNDEKLCYKKELWGYIKKYRLQIVLDNNCKPKYRILAFVAFSGQKSLRRFFRFASRR